MAVAGSGDITFPGALVADLGVSGGGATSFGFGITRAGYLVDLELSALATDGHAEVVARPKVITADKSPAIIESGVEIPYQEATSSGATSTSFKDAVLSLEVTPQITPDDRIIMDLNVKQDTVGQIFNGVPSINTNESRLKCWWIMGKRSCWAEFSKRTKTFLRRRRRSLVTSPMWVGSLSAPSNVMINRNC
jgi:type IV pilus assembly protein PilQ